MGKENFSDLLASFWFLESMAAYCQFEISFQKSATIIVHSDASVLLLLLRVDLIFQELTDVGPENS